MRISYGLILLLDLASRACDLRAHYTDWGAVPRSAAVEMSTDPAYWSFHLMSGSLVFQALLFLLAALVSAAVLVGYRTTLSTVLAWIMLVSLHSRNAIVLDGGDVYLRCILFWCMFLPWGARWSWDARGLDPPAPAYRSVATLGLMLQFSCVYWVAAALKTGAEWRIDGTAVYYTLSLEQFSTPMAGWLLAQPALMRFLTFATLIFEGVGPFLIWIPGRIRLLGVLCFAGLHLSLGCFLYLGLFAIIGALTPIAFVPSEFWNRWEKTSGSAGKLVGPHNLVQIALANLLALVVVWNLQTIPRVHLPFRAPSRVLQFLRLDQNWTMFAPKPLIEDGWYVVEAEQRNGRKIDILRGGAPVDWSKPAGVNAHYVNARWRKLMMNLWDVNLSGWRQPFGRYLTRSWNGSHAAPDQVLRFHIYFMLERTLPVGVAPVEKKMIWYHRCFEDVL